jgi:eukaryotic-like serine/threonine-protein kinase
MTPERFARISQLYSEAADLAPEARPAFLAQACDGDDDLRQEVESLLAEEVRVGDFIGASALKDAAALVTAESPGTLIGKQLGPYELLSFIGAGGMGEVYAARDTRIGRKVAVKLLPRSVASDADRLRRFEQEVRAVGSLNHPNILTIHDVGTYEGVPYLVSELLEGETLRERLKSGPLQLTRAVNIALQITHGLAAAHEKGLVHRDLKPENLFINRDGRVKILDFGLAKLSQNRSNGLHAAEQMVSTNPGLIMGTVGYMSPEQLRGDAVDGRADIFAFGVILYEMLTGQRPFHGISPAETMSAILTREAPDLPVQVSAQAPGLERLIHRCLEKQLERRFQSASDLAFALDAMTMPVLTPSEALKAPMPDGVHGEPTLRLKASVSRMNWLGWAGWILAGLLLFATAAGFWMRSFRGPPVSPRVVPFTSFPGQKASPVFSPDGNQIAFIWEGGEKEERGVYVKVIGEGSPLRVASNPGQQVAWSPDGRLVAFNRPGSEGGIFTVPATGGPERRLSEMNGSFSFSSDEKTLAIATRSSQEGPSKIVLLTLESGATRSLTNPPEGFVGDVSPSFAPDGRKLAFIRNPGTQVSDVYVVATAGGEPERLTFNNLFLTGGLAWTRDGREIVFSSTHGGLPTLWRVRAAGGGGLRRVIGSGEYANQPAISESGDRLAYLYRKIDSNIWRAPGPLSTSPSAEPIPIARSTREESSPQYSLDGRHITFVSDRSGSREIWVSESDGSNPVQLTNFGGSHAGSPRWSPDGRQIAFDSRPTGLSSIYIVDVAGGSPRRLTDGKFEDVLPSWSHDGHWIYFGSRRSGDWQIWRINVENESVEQVTHNGGFEAFESADRKTLYYARREPGIWKIPTDGGEETKVLEDGGWGYWTVFSGGICLIRPSGASQMTLEFFNFATGQKKAMRQLERTRAFGGSPSLSVSADGRWILYRQVDQDDSDIMLLENFR